MEGTKWIGYTVEDLSSVRNNQWLTTQAVFLGCYDAVMKHNSSGRGIKESLIHIEYSHTFMTSKNSEQTQKPDPKTYTFFGDVATDSVYMPCIAKGHFFLMNYRKTENVIYYADPLFETHYNEEEIRKLWEPFGVRSPSIVYLSEEQIEKQEDGTSCGIRTVYYCRKFLKDGPRGKAEKIDIEHERTSLETMLIANYDRIDKENDTEDCEKNQCSTSKKEKTRIDDFPNPEKRRKRKRCSKQAGRLAKKVRKDEDDTKSVAMEDTETLYDAALPAPDGKISVTGQTASSSLAPSSESSSAVNAPDVPSAEETAATPGPQSLQMEVIKLSQDPVPRKNKVEMDGNERTAKLREKVLDLPIEARYPTDTFLPKKRHNLRLENEKTASTLAVYEDCQSCIICRGGKENEELVMCQGVANGFPINVSCPSVFHLTCLTTYNADRFRAQHAALPECANGIFCPLHYCAVCSVDKRKQSSFAGAMIECALCFRSYHDSSCIPAGYRKISVGLKTDSARLEKQAEKTIEMIICPSHAEFETMQVDGSHREVCDLCGNVDNEELTQCSTCLYSFHTGCKEVETVDGKPIADQCGNCACRTTFKLGMPVYYRNRNSWSLAIGKRWEEVDDEAVKSLLHFGEVGYVLLHKEGSGSRPSKYLVKQVRRVVAFCPYVYSKLSKAQEKKNENFLMRKKAYTAALPGHRKRIELIERCTYSTNSEETMEHVDLDDRCDCTGPRKCANDSCFFRNTESECPVGCKKLDGQDCENRKIANMFFHPSMELREAGKKGYGLFATSPIRKGEFLCEYVGEILDQNQAAVKKALGSEDNQMPLYMMALRNGLTIDSATRGNLSRFINHACFPNTEVRSKRVFYDTSSEFTPGFQTDGRTKVDHKQYVTRMYFAAKKNIEKDEELTMDYKFDLKYAQECFCGSKPCGGTMAGLSGKK